VATFSESMPAAIGMRTRRSATLGAADRRVRIPMAAGMDSLNVATAAAIAFHRLAR